MQSHPNFEGTGAVLIRPTRCSPEIMPLGKAHRVRPTANRVHRCFALAERRRRDVNSCQIWQSSVESGDCGSSFRARSAA